jgi:hypothetical protein
MVHLKAYAAQHTRSLRTDAMTLCPIAIAVGCKKCPAFAVCPLKSTLGDFKPDETAASKKPAAADKTAAKKKS